MLSAIDRQYTQIFFNVLAQATAQAETKAELAVVNAVLLKTIPLGKQGEWISISQLQADTGLARASVVTGLAAAIKKGLLLERQIGPRNRKVRILMLPCEKMERLTARLDAGEVTDTDFAALAVEVQA